MARSVRLNARVEVDDLIAEAGRVVMRYGCSAVRASPILHFSATSKRVEMPGVLVARLAGGKLAEYWRREDMLGLLR